MILPPRHPGGLNALNADLWALMTGRATLAYRVGLPLEVRRGRRHPLPLSPAAPAIAVWSPGPQPLWQFEKGTQAMAGSPRQWLGRSSNPAPLHFAK